MIRLLWSQTENLYFLLFFLLMMLLPLYFSSYIVFVLSLIGAFAVGGMGMVVLTGHTGPFNLGFAGFMAIGAYASAIVQDAGLPFGAGLVSAILVGVLTGIIVGIPSVRLSDFAIAIVTYGFGIVVLEVIKAFPELTGGLQGMIVTGPRTLPMYYYTWILCGGLALTLNLFLSSWWGRLFRAVRDGEIAASSFGVPILRIKIVSFAVSSALASLCGALYGQSVGYISPPAFDLWLSLAFIVILVIGGIRSLIGAFLGAAFWVVIPEVASGYTGLTPILFGVLTILTVLFLPEGLASLLPRRRKS